MENGSKVHVTAVLKAFHIISMLAEEGQLGVSEIALKLASAKSSTHRILQTLQDLNIIAQDQESNNYFLTLKLTALGSKIASGLDIVTLANPYMRRINDMTSETVHLGILEGTRVVYVQKFDSKYTLRLYSQVGKRAPIHCTSLGKVLTAWKDTDEINAILDRIKLDKYTDKSLTDKEEIKAELLKVRQQIFAEDNEEHEENVTCIAVPIFNYSGQAVAGMSVSVPSFRMENINRQEYITLLQEAGKDLSGTLGAPSYPPK